MARKSGGCTAFYDNNREEFRHSFYFEYQLLWHQQQDDLTFNDVFYYFEGHAAATTPKAAIFTTIAEIEKKCRERIVSSIPPFEKRMLLLPVLPLSSRGQDHQLNLR